MNFCFLFLVRLIWRLSPQCFPSLGLALRPFRNMSSDPTGKSLPRWRLALAQGDARGTSPRSRFHGDTVSSFSLIGATLH